MSTQPSHNSSSSASSSSSSSSSSSLSRGAKAAQKMMDARLSDNTKKRYAYMISRMEAHFQAHHVPFTHPLSVTTVREFFGNLVDSGEEEKEKEKKKCLAVSTVQSYKSALKDWHKLQLLVWLNWHETYYSVRPRMTGNVKGLLSSGGITGCNIMSVVS